MSDDEESRTILIGRKRDREEDSSSAAKRQRRGTQDDAISIDESSVSSDGGLAKNTDGFFSITTHEGPKNSLDTRLDNLENPKIAKTKKKKKPKNKKPNLGDLFKEADELTVRCLQGRIILPEHQDLVMLLLADARTMSRRKAKTRTNIRVPMLEFCARNLTHGLLAIGSLSKRQTQKVQIAGVLAASILYLRFDSPAHFDAALQTVWTQSWPEEGMAGIVKRLRAMPFMDVEEEKRFEPATLPKHQRVHFFQARKAFIAEVETSQPNQSQLVAIGLAEENGISGDNGLSGSDEESSESQSTNGTSREKKPTTPEPISEDESQSDISHPAVMKRSLHSPTRIDLPVERSASEGEILTEDSTPVAYVSEVSAIIPTIPESGPIYLRNLSAKDRSLQSRYWGIFADDELARCPLCSRSGHMTSTCPSRTCSYCGTMDDHFSAACPSHQKCSKCRERGHAPSACPSKLIRSAADGFSCDICAGTHTEEECSWIWRSFNPALLPTIHKIDRLAPVGCYQCGAIAHMGDDCPEPFRKKSSASNCNTFSAAFANLFTITQMSAPPPLPASGNGFSIKGRGRPATARSDEEDLGDDSAFYNKRRNNPSSRRGAIHVNVGRQDVYEPHAPHRNGQGGGSHGGAHGYRNVPPPQQYYNSEQHHAGGRFAQSRRDLPPRESDGGPGRTQFGGGRGRGGRGGGGRGGYRGR